MANSQGISEATSGKAQPKANAEASSPKNNLSSQQTVRTNSSRNKSNGPKPSGRADNNPNKSAGAEVIEATQGTFRFDTGSQAKRFHIKTPYGGLDVGGWGTAQQSLAATSTKPIWHLGDISAAP
jgi:hypothetical protein